MDRRETKDCPSFWFIPPTFTLIFYFSLTPFPPSDSGISQTEIIYAQDGLICGLRFYPRLPGQQPHQNINLQHYLAVQLFGYRIHPSIPTKNPDLRIADVGTGTGIWLTDLAEELPKSARLDAMDISFAATPLPEMLPSNMSLHHWDVKTDVPEHLVGVYDVIHLRFFAFVVQEHELDAVLDRLLKLLKPGGYIQWTDIDVSSLRLDKIRPDIQADAQVKLMNMFKGNDSRLNSAWVPTLAKRFANKGLTDVITDAREAPPHLALALHEVGLLATEVLSREKASSGNEEAAKAMKQTLAQAAKETRDGSYLAFTRYTVVARKKVDTV